jgi:hypothetical protein
MEYKTSNVFMTVLHVHCVVCSVQQSVYVNVVKVRVYFA